MARKKMPRFASVECRELPRDGEQGAYVHPACLVTGRTAGGEQVTLYYGRDAAEAARVAEEHEPK